MTAATSRDDDIDALMERLKYTGTDHLAAKMVLARLTREARDERDAARTELDEDGQGGFADRYPCQRCGRRDGLDAVIPSQLWAQITAGTLWPSGEVTDGRWNILCLWCIDQLCAEHGITCSATLHFMGRQITAGSQSDADTEHIDRLVSAREHAHAELAGVAAERDEALAALRELANAAQQVYGVEPLIKTHETLIPGSWQKLARLAEAALAKPESDFT